MKVIFILAILINFSFADQKIESRKLSDDQTSESRVQKPKVLVELFTSQGCSTCPPADRALLYLQNEQPFNSAEIVTLSFHVDYWNNSSWKDEFSSDLFTQRQRFYSESFRLSTIYTPQMIVDGAFQFAGSNLRKAEERITQSARTTKAEIDLKLLENTLSVQISKVPIHLDSTVYVAIAEDKLDSNSSSGEKSGSKRKHISVVRELKFLGQLKQDDQDFKSEAAIELQGNWKKDKLKFVVFIQENRSRKILGVNYLKLQK